MLKNKKLTYILLLIVALIWYKVIFRVISNFTEEDIQVPKPNNTTVAFHSVHREEFQLQANYRDPFRLKKASSMPFNTELNEKIPVIQKNSQPVKKVIRDSWPSIKYKGLIRQTTSNNPLAIIVIDDIELHMRKGEKVFDGILLKQVGRDSVVVFYQKEKRIFYRN